MKQKSLRKLIVGMTILSMALVYGSVPAKAVTSLTNVQDVLSTSGNSLVATHSITASTTQVIPVNGYSQVIFATSTFTGIDVANVTCHDTASTTKSVTIDASGTTVKCTADQGDPIAIGNKAITITNVTNPAATSSYVMTMETRASDDTLLERAQFRVAILNRVVMSATVEATLTFTVSGTSTGVTVGGIATTATSSTTTLPFGTLVVDQSHAVAQDLRVATNATYGYIVTVEQDHELRNSQNDTINSFNNSPDGTGSTTPDVWANPLGVLDQKNTYGHMGLTTNDSDINSGDGYSDFTGNKYAGLNSTDTMIVMAHANSAAGPADGLTQDKGYATVLYRVRVGALQEAGDYSNTLTYICTPTY